MMGLVPAASGSINLNNYAEYARPSVIYSENDEGIANLAHITYEPLPEHKITHITYQFAKYNDVPAENQTNRICYRYNYGLNEKCVDFYNATQGVSYAFSGLTNRGSFEFRHKVTNAQYPVGSSMNDYVIVFW